MQKLPERPIYMAVATLTPEAKPIGYLIESLQELINPAIWLQLTEILEYINIVGI